jgi:type VI secretion system secreted protein VgrG
VTDNVLLVDNVGFESTATTGMDLVLTGARGREEISRMYAYEIDLSTTTDGGLDDEDVDEVLRLGARLWFGRGETLATVHGVVRSVELLPAIDARRLGYRFVLVPRVARLGHTQRSRVFHSTSYPAIVRSILIEHGFVEDEDFEMRLTRGARAANEELPEPGPADDDFADYPQREYTAQYEETDLAFVERLLEHEGIFYWFVQDDGRDKIVFGDRNARLGTHEALAFEPRASADRSAALASISRVRRSGSSNLEVREYNWRTPDVAMFAQAEIDGATGVGTWAGYGEHFRTPQEGERYARIRAEERLLDRETYDGLATSPTLSAGVRVPVSGCVLPALDKEYLVTHVERTLRKDEGQAGAVFHVRFGAIDAGTPFRPRRRTPKPRIHGVVHARIDGPVAGMVAPIDDHGRYKVVLPYDTASHETGRASRWIRMAQPSSGEGYGIHFPLHVGVEVLLAHVRGDPDRPVIVGAVPNASTVTPVTRDNATQSQVRTRSGILMEFEDDA